MLPHSECTGSEGSSASRANVENSLAKIERTMKKLKSERHHWWPRCVSRHWMAGDGTVGWIEPDGSEKRIPPDKLGMIGNGHHIKLGQEPGQTTQLDESFEDQFDLADSSFPGMIGWCRSLMRRAIDSNNLHDRFLPQPATDAQLRTLTECVVSLAVRGPMNRNSYLLLAERIRGTPLSSVEKNVVIGLNMRNSQRVIADSIGVNAKFAVLFAEKGEFIYGDGFYHNVSGVTNSPINPQILAPITPTMSILICRPFQFSSEPRLVSLSLTEEEVDRCNHAVQVYARSALFYRSIRPAVDQAFRQSSHLQYSSHLNPIASLCDALAAFNRRE